MSLPNPLYSAITIIGVAVSWVVLFNLNGALFAELEFSERAHWIFLPAAFRILFVLLFRQIGAIGLIVGAFFTLPHGAASPFLHELFLSISSGLAPLIAVAFATRFMGIEIDLQGLRGIQIIVLSFACAIVNSLIVNFYLILALEPNPPLMQVASIFVGDVLGAAILLIVIATSLILVERFRSARIRS